MQIVSLLLVTDLHENVVLFTDSDKTSLFRSEKSEDVKVNRISDVSHQLSGKGLMINLLHRGFVEQSGGRCWVFGLLQTEP